jgi:hypothetical protein
MKNITSILLITILINCIECFPQTIDKPSISETNDYLRNSFDLNIDIKELKTLALNNNIKESNQDYSKFFNHKYVTGVKNYGYHGDLSFEYSDAFNGRVECSFNIINIEIGNIIFNQSNYSFTISCKQSRDCIKLGKDLCKKITVVSPNQANISRFNNSLSHLQSLLIKNPELVAKAIDPFDNYEVKEQPSINISIPSIKFEDQNKNNRIDESEVTSLIVSLKNHNQYNISNLTIEINEINKIKGLIFQEKHIIPTLTNNQSKSVDIKINSNNELQIGEANFEIKILNNNKEEITKKFVKISTFNSGPQEFLISKLSKVDIDIPKTTSIRKNTYAIVIGNEDYKSKQPSLSYESNVKYAVNDAKIFQEYLINTIGVPNTNITYLTNATSAQIKQAINKVKQLPLVNANAEIIFYYAGHGLPDEKTKEQYLIPVDVNSSNLTFGLKINEIETELSSNNPKQVLLILDACFSGAARNESILSNRAVRVRPKENVIKGNSIIISASSNEEASKAYDEMQHGMFTYFLLKKIQETKGNVDLQTLFDFLHFNVREKSLLINNQFQTPTITKSPQIQNNLNEIKF